MNKERRTKLTNLLNRLQTTGLRDAMDNLIAIRDELESVTEDEEQAQDNTPEHLQNRDAWEALDEAHGILSDLIDGFDFDDIEHAYARIVDAVGGAQ